MSDISREELERDLTSLVSQLNQIRGAISYVQQKIAALDKLKKKEEQEDKDEQEVVKE